MENEEFVIEKEFMEAFKRLPTRFAWILDRMLKSPGGQEFGYTWGYIVGIRFVIETVVEPT